ncbi:HEAT repeat-containing protein 6 [Drosophila nasuta]|uniref:HEAT repeat-containing protein 6 n=1 Tax=Drosophila nasuta TaxID=42062 RepID=UPI00295E30CC|nr:HEAT repeat-containing protein 6 [Drosophila nasuta]
MDKERRAYEALLQTVNTRLRSARPADQVHHERQLQFLRDIDSQTPTPPYGIQRAAQLTQLLTEVAGEGQKSANADGESLQLLNLWLQWLHELLHSRRQLLGDETQSLRDWLLQRLTQQNTNDVETLRCLLPLLDALPVGVARAQLPQLAAIPLPSSMEAALLLLLCQDAMLGALTELQPAELQLCSQLASTLLHAHYAGSWLLQASQLSTAGLQEQQTLLVAHSLLVLQKIAALHAEYAQQQAPELLGLALSYMRRLDTSATLQLPHRVQPAQQSLAAYGQDADELQAASSQSNAAAGRRVKSRKMRSLAKQRTEPVQPTTSGAQEERLQQLLLQGSTAASNGDSNSNSDNAAGAQSAGVKQQRQCQVKLRLAALQLLGAVTKQLPRRLLYGYWHALFPSNSAGDADHLLQLGANDGNVRCRALALQLAAQLYYGSKPFLSQANDTTAPSNYTPFALSLASSVLAAYGQLTGILQREFAPPVLTQCLKCLAVLVQATPFDQLQMGFVYEFVPHVKKLARHMDTGVKVSALLVMEMLVATTRLTQEIACAVGLPLSERKAVVERQRHNVRAAPEFEQLCDSEEEAEEEQEEQEQLPNPATQPSIPRNSWLLRLVLRYLDCPGSAAPLRLECLQVILAMATHFALLRDHLGRLAAVLSAALADPSLDVRLYGARCLDAVGFQMARQAQEQQQTEEEQRQLQQHLLFWQRLLQSIYVAYLAASSATLKCALCDALSNMGVWSFERLPQPQRNALLAFLLGCSSDDAADPLVRAAALRALAVYVLQPTLRADLVFVEHAAELALRLIGDPQLAVRIKAAWALGNISDALVAPSLEAKKRQEEKQRQAEKAKQQRQQQQLEEEVELDIELQEVEAEEEQEIEQQQETAQQKKEKQEEEEEEEDHAQLEQEEHISQSLLMRLIEAAVAACSDHDKVRANAVRALGNLLRLLPSAEHELMLRAMSKLLDCVRAAGSAKVKWNACYALGNLVRNRSLFASSGSLAGTLFTTLGQLIVQHANFKVRINATAVLLQIEHRADFGQHYAGMWAALVAATERSNALDTFVEYNHRDGLQQQLCLAMAHMLARARPDDLLTCRQAMESQLEAISGTWRRVAYRILPEQATALFNCGSMLQQRFAANALTGEQRNALTFLVAALRLES